MTGKADFTEEEWTRLKRAPFVAGMAISLSDPGGPIELAKETAAALKTVSGGELARSTWSLPSRPTRPPSASTRWAVQAQERPRRSSTSSPR